MNRQVQFQFPSPGPLTKAVIGALALAFLGTLALSAVYPAALGVLVLDPDAVLQGRLWTLVTYVLVAPGDIFGLIFTLLAVFFFGTDLEKRWGRQRFLSFLVASAFAGGVLATIFYLFGFPPALIRGPEPLAFALFAAWALTFPEREILLFFILPVKGKHLFWFEVVLVIIQVVRGGLPAVPDIGALLVATALVYGVFRPDMMRSHIDHLLTFLRLKKKPKLQVVPPAVSKKWGEQGSDKYIQ